MREFSIIWFLLSALVLPCTLNLENMWCLLFIMVNLLASFLFMRRYARDCFND